MTSPPSADATGFCHPQTIQYCESRTAFWYRAVSIPCSHEPFLAAVINRTSYSPNGAARRTVAALVISV